MVVRMEPDVAAERERLRAEFRRRAGRQTPRESEPTTHFGVRVQRGSKYGLRLARDEYAQINKQSSSYWRRDLNPALWDALDGNYEDADHRVYTDTWCEAQRERALRNFDLNVAFMQSLDPHEFDDAIRTHVAERPRMREVSDLNAWAGRAGLYVMVLDDYCQAYVGTTSSSVGIMARVRQHWQRSKAFDRLLWGTVETSILSIDSFRALDTTRIFAIGKSDPYALEHRLVESIPPKFLLNRVPGGGGQMVGWVSALGGDVVRQRTLRDEEDSPIT